MATLFIEDCGRFLTRPYNALILLNRDEEDIMNSYTENQLRHAADVSDMKDEDRIHFFAALTSLHPQGITEQGMTPLWSLDHILQVLESKGIPFEKRVDIGYQLNSEGPHSTLMSAELASSLGVDNALYKPEDIRRAFLRMEVDPGWTATFFNELKNIRDERTHVRRIKVSEIDFNDAGKRIRFPSATIPRWQVFTDMKPLAYPTTDPVRDYILVLDGKVVICDDVPIDIDDRKVKTDG